MRYSTLSESFTGDSYVKGLLSKIIERIQEKEANKEYSEFRSRFDQSVLVIYLDDLLLTTHELEIITSQNIFSDLMQLFNEVYLYIRPTYHTSPSDIKYVWRLLSNRELISVYGEIGKTIHDQQQQIHGEHR